MRGFYNEKNNNLIIVPFLNGSSFLLNNIDTFQLTYLNLSQVVGRSTFKSLLSTPDIKKTIFYRDPLERFISFYMKFVQSQVKNYKNINYITAKLKSTVGVPSASQIALLKLIEERSIWQNIFYSLDELEKIYLDDAHTAPQTKYFTTVEEDIHEYEVLDVVDYNKWIYLNFKYKNEFTSILKKDDVTKGITGMEIFQCLEIYNRLKLLYKDDYNLFPKFIQRL